MATTAPPAHVAPAPPTALLIGVLGLLHAIAPLASDMYLPGLPEMADDLGTSVTAVQATLSTFLVGLAVGQLVVGPLSDGWGRRPLLLAGSSVCVVASVVCVVAPTVEVLIAARFFQGLGGAAGIVLSRAIIADTTHGPSTARIIGVMMIVGGTAPVVAPLIGGVTVGLGGWRATLGLLAVLSVVMLLAATLFVKETLPPERRHAGGLRSTLVRGREVLRRRRYVGFMLTGVLGFTTLFSYISASSFVLQRGLGLSTTQYSLTFGLNALGMVSVAFVAIRLAGRVPYVRMVAGGLAVSITASLGLLALGVTTGLDGAPAALTIVLLLLAVSSLGMVMGNSTALATEEARDLAGTGSAWQGFLQFGAGALVSPVIGLTGEASWAMGLSMSVAALLALGALTFGATGRRRA